MPCRDCRWISAKVRSGHSKRRPGKIFLESKYVFCDSHPLQLGKPDLVLFFDCKESIAADRYLTRKLDGRLDDNEEMFYRRYEEFQRLNADVLDYYRNLGVLVTVCLYT